MLWIKLQESGGIEACVAFVCQTTLSEVNNFVKHIAYAQGQQHHARHPLRSAHMKRT